MENDGAWRRVTDAELRALAPFTLHVQGLKDGAVRTVEAEYHKMLRRGVSRLLHHLDRPPTQQEAELLAKAIVKFLNEATIPLLTARGHASLH